MKKIFALSIFLFLLSFIPASAATILKPANNLGLVAYYHFNEGTGITAGDASGQGKTATLTGGTAWTDGYHGKAVAVDGVDDSLNTASPVTTATNNITFSTWVYWEDTSDFANFAYNGDGGSNGYGFIVSGGACANGNKVGILVGGINCDALSSSYSLSSNKWVHLTAVRDAGTWKLYVDGVLVVTGGSTSPNTPTTATYPATGLFHGKIDDMRFYNRVLSPAEISRLYNAGEAKYTNATKVGLIAHYTFDETSGTVLNDRSGQGNDGVLTNGPTFTTGKFKNALNFDGANDRVVIPDDNSLDSTSEMTISVWFKADAYANPYNELVVKGGHYYVRMNNSQSKMELLWLDGTNVRTMTPTRPSTGVWHHGVMVIKNNDIHKWYLNGVDSSTAVSTYFALGRTLTDSLGIGDQSQGTPDEVWDGLIDETRIYNRALTAAEVAKLYAETNPGRRVVINASLYTAPTSTPPAIDSPR
jgi:hypothetical protein